jgi:hypothetical protein
LGKENELDFVRQVLENGLQLGLKLLHGRSLGFGILELFLHQRHLHKRGLIKRIVKTNRYPFPFKGGGLEQKSEISMSRGVFSGDPKTTETEDGGFES